jgi:hypothetical protein
MRAEAEDVRYRALLQESALTSLSDLLFRLPYIQTHLNQRLRRPLTETLSKRMIAQCICRSV